MNLREKTWEILKEAISVNNRAFPWERAIGAGIAMALPIPELSEDELASLLYLFETLANSAKFSDIEAIKKIPEIPGFHSIEREIDTLQRAFIKKR